MIRLTFCSALDAPAANVWASVVSLAGINDEAMPLFRMTAPSGITSLTDTAFVPGQRLFRSTILAFGLIPIDWSDLKLDELNLGHSFVERSDMASMHSWEHIRVVEPDGAGCNLTDRLAFTPRLPAAITRRLISLAFRNRHRKLRNRFGGRRI